MKKALTILLLAFVLISVDAIQAYSWVTITIKIARKRDCIGFGWCKMIITGDLEIAKPKPVGNEGTATAEMSSDGHLVLSFNKKTDLSLYAYETYFSKGVFVCEDDFPVPFDLLESLNYKGKYTIKAGTYDVKENGDVLTVKF